MNSHKLDDIQPVESDRELFTSSATDVFMSIDDPEKLRQAQQAEFGPYFECRWIQPEEATTIKRAKHVHLIV